VGYIYFIQAEWQGLIKIGRSDIGPEKRLAGLRAASACPLVPLGIIWGGRDFEHRLHRRFADLHHHAEWFRPGDRLLRFIERWAHPWERLGVAPQRSEPRSPEEALARLRDPATRTRHPLSLWARDRGPARRLAV
jgi:hypothetical protein